MFEDLPVGAAVTVTETVPRFFRELEAEQTATIGRIAGLLFVVSRPRPESGR